MDRGRSGDGPAGIPGGRDLRAEVVTKYRAVARSPEGHFPYPTGRSGALLLGYRDEDLARLPEPIVSRFVGVGNPLGEQPALPGQRVLDVGCGAGVDTFLAALQVGGQGEVVGLDLTPEMVAVARDAARDAGLDNLRFDVGSAEGLPYEDASFDLLISNGALNLVVDKEVCFRDLARVLRPGGWLSIADLLVIESIPADTLARMDAWST